MSNYRFEYRIFDQDTDETIVKGTTFVLPDSVDEYGTCESVEFEVGSGLRFFKNKGMELYEDKKSFEEIWP